MSKVVSVLLVLGAFSVARAVTPTPANSVSTTSTKSAGITVEAVPVNFSNDTSSVRFAVMGDTGTGDSAQYQMAKEMATVHQSTDFNFVVMLGDNIYGGHSAGDLEKKFASPYKPLLDEGVKFYASLGNHDDSSETSYSPFNMNGHRYYTFTRNNAEFFVLDSNFMSGEQIAWLKDELQKSTADWKIAYFHHPLYSDGKRHGPSTDLRAVLAPIFKSYGVNIVLSGHDHVYERVSPQDGILYFVLGNSGQLRNGDLHQSSQEASGFDNDRCFMVMEIAGDELHFKTISRTGQTVDSGRVKLQHTAVATANGQTPTTAQAGTR